MARRQVGIAVATFQVLALDRHVHLLGGARHNKTPALDCKTGSFVAVVVSSPAAMRSTRLQRAANPTVRHRPVRWHGLLGGMLHTPDKYTAILKSESPHPAVFDLFEFFSVERDPLIASPFFFASPAAVALAAKGVAASAIWRERGGGDQNIAIDVRKAFQRFSGFMDGRWEQINGRPPSLKWNKYNPFFEVPFFRATKDGRHVIALNVYPGCTMRPWTCWTVRTTALPLTQLSPGGTPMLSRPPRAASAAKAALRANAAAGPTWFQCAPAMMPAAPGSSTSAGASAAASASCRQSSRRPRMAG